MNDFWSFVSGTLIGFFTALIICAFIISDNYSEIIKNQYGLFTEFDKAFYKLERIDSESKVILKLMGNPSDSIRILLGTSINPMKEAK